MCAAQRLLVEVEQKRKDAEKAERELQELVAKVQRAGVYVSAKKMNVCRLNRTQKVLSVLLI
jgi:t-SNARE complex subunit (syntaxin)